MSGAQQPVDERFSRRQVLRILGISERQLTAWERQGLVQPSPPLPPEAVGGSKPHSFPREEKRTKRSVAQDCRYTFSDIVTLKTLLQLRRSGVSPSRIRLAHSALKAKLAEVEKPWSELQIQGHGKNLSVYFQGTAMEPFTGQLLLEYAPREERTKIRTLQRPDHRKKRNEAERRVHAERFFMAGLRYEERVETIAKAIRAYQKAIELNPHAVGAFINLGTIYYNLGRLQEAEGCYRAALSLDSGYGLVYFNLGNVFDERNEWEKARQFYEEAVRLEPNYADPHYNLALVYEKLGLHGKARQQWHAYLKLDPQSQWAAYAHQQLEKTPLRVMPPQESSDDDS